MLSLNYFINCFTTLKDINYLGHKILDFEKNIISSQILALMY